MRLASAVAATLLFLVLLSAMPVAKVHALAAGAALALVIVSALRPHTGLLITAALVPVASWAGRGWASSELMWVDVVVIAFLSGFLARRAFDRSLPVPDPLPGAAALLMGLIVAASLAVQLATSLERLGPPAFRNQLAHLVTRADVVMVRPELPGVGAAALLLAGLALFAAAARLSQMSPAFQRRATAAVAVGALAAASVNVWRVAHAAIRSHSSLASVVELVSRQRINEHYADMNAAGSYFVLTVWVSIALALGRAHKAWMLASVIIAAALWMTGSRAAVLAGLIAAVVPVLSRADAGRARNWAIAGAVCGVLLIGAGLLAALMPMRGNQKSASTAVQVRIELTRTAMNMFASRPIFGIGTGEFYQRSGEFSSPTLLALFPPAQNENAHNNFLQILAELGAVGFAAFVALLVLAARRTAAAIVAGHRYLSAVAAGVVAFLISCLGGHPLLIPEVSATFWLVLGILSGAYVRATDATPDDTLRRSSGQALGQSAGQALRQSSGLGRLRWILATIAIVLVATIPLRARRQIADSNLEHVGIGLSGWHRTSDNRQYRILAGPSAAVFVPGNAGSVTVPLRAVPPRSWDVEIFLDGRLANVVHVGPDDWINALIVLPRQSNERRYLRVDLVVRDNPPEQGDVLLVGKVLPH